MKILAWLKSLLDDTPPPYRPRPAGWNKTLADLDAEKRSLSGEEIHWAREYDREQLRAWVRFPLNEEVFEATRDVPVTYIIDWRAPYSTGGDGVLPKGTRIRVSVLDGDPEPVMVYAIPVDEKAIAELLIPEDDRNSSKYGGYNLRIEVAKLNKEFELIDSPHAAPDIQ
jgi:hypothetical protein